MADHPSLTARRVLVGAALTAVGGFVDCFSYLALRNVYAATMSGNTVAIAVHAGIGESAPALLHAYTVGVFVAGLLLSAIAIEAALRRGIRHVLALALAIEIACLAALALWGAPLLAAGAEGTASHPRWPLYALLALAAIAMGTQNTSLRMAGILAIFTTHVTGTLTHFGEQFANFLFVRRRENSRAMLAHACFSATLWLAFLLGALAASELLPLWGAAKELALPISVLVLVIAADIRRPFAEPRRAPIT
ncbi:MAG TPA: YoaK family protein [Stellaceae bacterium]|nr:YoaK family protein [Stellaceae bacterium]